MRGQHGEGKKCEIGVEGLQPSWGNSLSPYLAAQDPMGIRKAGVRSLGYFFSPRLLLPNFSTELLLFLVLSSCSFVWSQQQT